MTLEGCVVRLSDIIAYLGRDIEDAERLGLFDKDNVPDNIKNILGNNNKDIVNNIILNVIKNSINKSYIALDDEVFNAIKDLKAFNYKHIYKKAHTNEELESYKKMYYDLFEKLLIILEKEDKNHNIYKLYLNYMNKEYLNNTSNARKVIDYIAGMTDDFFIKEYKNYQN